MTDGPGSDTYTYDNMGRRTQCVRVINSVSYTTSYTYNEMNEVTQTTYPSGRVVQQSYDSLARLCEVAPTTTGCGTAASPYSTGYAYSAASQLTSFNYGNGVSASFAYSPDRLLTTSLAYAKGSNALFSQNYSYVQGGGNDGQITAIADNVDNGRSAYYGYDALSRLVSASTVGDTNYSQWGLSWNYDRYGNRTAQNVTAGSAPSNQVSVSATTNQFTTAGYAYDAAGNMTNDGVNALVYDAENRVTSSSGGGGSGTYTYDGYSQRIEKSVSSATTAYIFSGSQVIAEYTAGAAAGSPTREYIYSGGALLANIAGSATQYYHQDQLSNRLMTDSNANVLGQQGHFPYGEQWYASNTTTKWFFTSYERDAESGNDYAMARYYVNRLGRFNTLDALSGSLGSPQSLNRYTYAINDPVNQVDPIGMCLGMGCDAGLCSEDGEPISVCNITGGGGGCEIDGSDEASCNFAFSLLGDGSAGVCPLPSCDGFEFVYNDYTGQNEFFNLLPAGSPYNPAVTTASVNGTLVLTYNAYPLQNVPVDDSFASWGWNFTKAFFGGLVSSAGWKAVYHSVVDEGGCDNLMFGTFAEAINPLPTDGPGVGDAAEFGPKAVLGAGGAAAMAYGAAKGLSVPMRSSVYRALSVSTKGVADVAEKYALPAQMAYATGDAVFAAGQAAYNGTCH